MYWKHYFIPNQVQFRFVQKLIYYMSYFGYLYIDLRFFLVFFSQRVVPFGKCKLLSSMFGRLHNLNDHGRIFVVTFTLWENYRSILSSFALSISFFIFFLISDNLSVLITAHSPPDHFLAFSTFLQNGGFHLFIHLAKTLPFLIKMNSQSNANWSFSFYIIRTWPNIHNFRTHFLLSTRTFYFFKHTLRMFFN